MAEVVKLKLADRPNEEKAVLEAWDRKHAEIREWIEGHGNGGFLIVAFHREPGEAITAVDYFVKDPMDLFILPDLAKEKLRAKRDSATLPPSN